MEENKTNVLTEAETAADEDTEKVCEACADTEDGDATEVKSDVDTDVDPQAENDIAHKRKKPFIPLITAAAVILAIALLITAAAVYAYMPHTAEAGEEIVLRTEALPWLYHTKTELDSIDKDNLAVHGITIDLLGFIPVNTKLTIQDTSAPKITVHSITVPYGYTPAPLDFLESASDKTDISYSLQITVAEDATASGMLIAADEGGNTAQVAVEYTCDTTLKNYTAEFGVSIDNIKYGVNAVNGIDEFDTSGIDIGTCGVYRVSGMRDGEVCVFDIIIADTIAPSATLKTLDIIVGDSLEISDLIEEMSDAADVTMKYITAPDINKPGLQTVVIELEDTSGNTSTFGTEIYVHNVSRKLTIEAGTDTESFNKYLYSLGSSLRALPWINIRSLEAGTHEIGVNGMFSSIPLEITIEDTTPPVFELLALTVYPGYTPNIKDFIESCTDASEVSFEYVTLPDVNKVGSSAVTIRATDKFGNSSEASTLITVKSDVVTPIIYGVKPITAYEGDSISYRSGVYAVDAKDGKVTVRVNSSGVNTSRPGTYTITYTATDRDNNTAVVTTTVTIKAVTAAVVNQLADDILSQITTPYMSKTQKARAVYDWCRANIKYSTLTSHLMGYFTKASYSGFTKHYGNCYTYYAVSSVLLTRAGITNMQISRNSTTDPHYWNLVYINNGWYHFDTCPQPAGHKAEVFLWTDRQLSEFTLDHYYKFDHSKYPATP